MRFQTSLEPTTSAARTTSNEYQGYWDNMSPEHVAHYMHVSQQQMQADDVFEGMHAMMDDRQELHTPVPRMPRSEQDGDRWRFERPMPGRDPVTAEKGLSG